MKIKKRFSLFLALLMIAMLAAIVIPVSAEVDSAVSSWDGTYPAANAGAAYSGGSGTAASPYLISSAADLAQLQANVNGNAGGGNFGYSNGKYFQMTCDINLNHLPWIGIGSTGVIARDQTYVATNLFRGVFDGNGHMIYNLNLKNDPSIVAQGFFAAAGFGACIQNFGVASGNITLSGDYPFIGAILGFSVKNQFSMINCFNGADIVNDPNYTTTKEQYVGGLVGMISAFGTDCSIENCLNFGSITCRQSDLCYKIGGIIGEYKSNGSGTAIMTNCTNIGASVSEHGTTGGNNIGSLVGYFEKTSVTMKRCLAGGCITTRTLNNRTAGAIGVIATVTMNVSDCTYHCPITVTGNSSTTSYEQTAIGKVWGTVPDTTGFVKSEKEICAINTCLFANNSYQQGIEELSRVRFLSELCVSHEALEEVGFEMTLTYQGQSKNVVCSSHSVYTSILAAGVSCTPSVGNAYVAYGITNMPVNANDTVTVSYRPYAVLNGVTIYGVESTLIFQGGIAS